MLRERRALAVSIRLEVWLSGLFPPELVSVLVFPWNMVVSF